jgi:hypothetical protein
MLFNFCACNTNLNLFKLAQPEVAGAAPGRGGTLRACVTRSARPSTVTEFTGKPVTMPPVECLNTEYSFCGFTQCPNWAALPSLSQAMTV